MGKAKTSDHIQIDIRMLNPGQEHPLSSKAPNQDSKEMDVLCTLKIKIEGQNSEQMCIKHPCPYPNKDQDAEPQSRPSSIIKGPRDSTSTTQ